MLYTKVIYRKLVRVPRRRRNHKFKVNGCLWYKLAKHPQKQLQHGPISNPLVDLPPMHKLQTL